MRIRSIITFVLAVGISLFAAMYRWGDSGHAIGLMSVNGGKVRHPSQMQSGWNRYTQITTATVLPPYRGDVRVALEGNPALEHEIMFSRPVVDLGLRRRPVFQDGVLYGVNPRDRLAFWVRMRPLPSDPVCGMAVQKGDPALQHKGKTVSFCGDACLARFKADPKKYESNIGPRGKVNLSFYDTKTGHSVLKVPILFEGKEASHASGGHH